MATTTTSIRLNDELRHGLAQLAQQEGSTLTELIERFVSEGLATSRHPGIVFKPGSSGRRAALAGGPDIWEVAAALRHTSGSEAKRVACLAREFGLHERQIVLALDYITYHREQIQVEVAANDRALAEVERLATERQRLLA